MDRRTLVRTFLGISVVAAPLLACGPTASLPPEPSLAPLATQMVPMVCAALGQACRDASLPYDQERCLATKYDLSRTLEASHTRVFHQELAKACVDVMRDRLPALVTRTPSPKAFAEVVTACSGVIEGLSPPSGVCDYPLDCAVSKDSDTAICSNAMCDLVHAPAPPGSICDESPSNVHEKTPCDHTIGRCEAKTCVPIAPLGGACLGWPFECGEDADCIERTCVGRAKPGEACGAKSCVTGTFCYVDPSAAADAPHVCRFLLENGAVCTESGACESAYCDAGENGTSTTSAPGKCAPYPVKAPRNAFVVSADSCLEGPAGGSWIALF